MIKDQMSPQLWKGYEAPLSEALEMHYVFVQNYLYSIEKL